MLLGIIQWSDENKVPIQILLGAVGDDGVIADDEWVHSIFIE